MAMTNAQKQAKHRLAVKERTARYEAALEQIQTISIWGVESAFTMREIARKALNLTTTPKTPE